MPIARLEAADDIAAIHAVNRDAFGGPDEAVLVDALRRDGLVIASLVADDNSAVVGHILFSRVFIHTATNRIPAVALAPMAVVPARQRRGIGSMLVRAGLERCRVLGEHIVLVVGHPAYYPRFGFSHALTGHLRSPYEGEAFMALELNPGALRGVTGEVRYPPAFAAVS
jgi:putative acetyltransferase